MSHIRERWVYTTDPETASVGRVLSPARPNRCRHDAIWIPTHPKSLNDRDCENARFARPCRHSLAAPEGPHDSIIGAVRRLLDARGPAAIPGLVASGVVFPINGVGEAGSRPHVFKKCSEAAIPSLADADAGAPIAGISGRIGRGASTAHGLPNRVFGSIASPVFDATTAQGRARFAHEASATPDASVPQHRRGCDVRPSAVAPTFPIAKAATTESVTERHQASKALASDVNRRGHASPVSMG